MAAASGSELRRHSEPAGDAAEAAAPVAASGARRSGGGGGGGAPSASPRSARPKGTPGAMRDLLCAVEASLTARAARDGPGSGGAQTHRRLEPRVRAHVAELLRRSNTRWWASSRGKELAPPKLHPAILRTIREWFDLAAQIPADARSIDEMIRMMDANRDGRIGWSEFESFLMQEFAAGRHLLSGEYVLPSGLSLPFGVMISKLKRSQMLGDVMAGGEARGKWVKYTGDLTADSAAIAAAEEAIQLQKAYNETLHLVDDGGGGGGAGGGAGGNGGGHGGGEAAEAAGAEALAPAAARAPRGGGGWALPVAGAARGLQGPEAAGPAALLAAPIGGRGGAGARPQGPGQQERLQQRTAAAAAAAAVPRLRLGTLSGSGGAQPRPQAASPPLEVERLLGSLPPGLRAGPTAAGAGGTGVAAAAATPRTASSRGGHQEQGRAGSPAAAQRRALSIDGAGVGRGGGSPRPRPSDDSWGTSASAALSDRRRRELRRAAAAGGGGASARVGAWRAGPAPLPAQAGAAGCGWGGAGVIGCCASGGGRPGAQLLGPAGLALPVSARYLNTTSTAAQLPPGAVLSPRLPLLAHPVGQQACRGQRCEGDPPAGSAVRSADRSAQRAAAAAAGPPPAPVRRRSSGGGGESGSGGGGGSSRGGGRVPAGAMTNDRAAEEQKVGAASAALRVEGGARRRRAVRKPSPPPRLSYSGIAPHGPPDP
ncbi:hypothetical protein Rsub_08472 [Raphidocelis subcapitata]|uniref:EF-hand domain-containing protein n=1 Tax=Raphidocelis subcapitata TaxID=307507 RepID=A0A2V0P7P3_9CHLO|nr:hypothetical protein Rsub_08472 [Raphidocelis subcapitata]|eukprot:GBF95881.1 hypothetical protein Rsub_08472 [Raphidocelis subcapitata]